MKKNAVVLSLLVIVLALISTGCKYPETLEERVIHATISERVYEKHRDYYYIVLTGESGEDTLSFRTNKKLYENTKIGQTMDITFRRANYLDGTADRYYFNGQELDDCFTQKAEGGFRLKLVKAYDSTEFIYTGEGMYSRYTTYNLTFEDENGCKVSAYDVSYSLWQSLYEGESLAFERKENTAKLKTYAYDYYLNGEWLFNQ